jgi:hypothetical protein
MDMKPLIAAALLLGGCGLFSGQEPARIVARDQNGISIRAGKAVPTYNMAALHCQYYGKIAVPNGIESVGSDEVTRFYVCR